MAETPECDCTSCTAKRRYGYAIGCCPRRLSHGATCICAATFIADPLELSDDARHAAPAAPSVGEPESTLASLWGSSPDARRATPDETIANLLAENAALRSSLEEARKDSERLDWLMTTAIEPWTRASIDTARGEP